MKGKIITWKDEKGFGFIKPNDGDKTVFLHISALNKAVRRPKVGDIVLYQKVIEPDGKIRAAKASLQGVASKSLSTKQKLRKKGLLTTVSGMVTLAVTSLFAMELRPSSFPPPVTSIKKPECNIKGNISIKTGNKIYHLPGMEDYESTIIDLSKGERWFCSESEAKKNGWRKAPR